MKLDPAEMDDAVTWTLSRAARTIEHRLTAVIASHGLSAVQFGVLAQLSAHDSLTRAELARETMTTPQSMSGVIEGMVAKGLLEMSGAGGKGRPNPVALTAKGRETIEAVWPPFMEANSASALGLSEDEAATLNALLHRLRQLA